MWAKGVQVNPWFWEIAKVIKDAKRKTTEVPVLNPGNLRFGSVRFGFVKLECLRFGS